MINKIKEWINSDDCECEESFETFEKCCGKDLDILKNLETWTNKERITPRFKDLDLNKQKEIINKIRKVSNER